MPAKKSSNTKSTVGSVELPRMSRDVRLLPPDLPSPDMAMVEKLIVEAKARARASSAQRTRDGRRSGTERLSYRSYSQKARGFLCPITSLKVSGFITDFLWGFIFTFCVMYVVLTVVYHQRGLYTR